MSLDRLLSLLAVPLACLFLILMLCVFTFQSPVSSGIRIPMMRARAKPLSFCEFNGFTVYLRSDGRIGGGDHDSTVSKSEMLSRIADARDNIQDDTIFVITDPEVPFEQFAELLTNIQNVAPADHVAVVTGMGQVEVFVGSSETRKEWADRCRFEWPAVAGQQKWSDERQAPVTAERLKSRSLWEALTSRKKSDL
jgi:biopolymer transport protein ExbD